LPVIGRTRHQLPAGLNDSARLVHCLSAENYRPRRVSVRLFVSSNSVRSAQRLRRDLSHRDFVPARRINGDRDRHVRIALAHGDLLAYGKLRHPNNRRKPSRPLPIGRGRGVCAVHAGLRVSGASRLPGRAKRWPWNRRPSCLRIESQRVQLRTAASANGHLVWRRGIRKCFYPLRFQHIPSLAFVAARVLTSENVADAMRICKPSRKAAVQAR
jgi:hypothetical protein